MGVYIKGMEMPKNCIDCHCMDEEYFWCGPANRNLKTVTTDCRPDFCPLIEVPEQHGRLGDLDALRKRIEENIDAAKKAGNHEWWYACTVALDFAQAAQAIIEAEEG